MSSVFIITLALCTGLTTASLCMTKYTLGKSYLKYCSDRCCYYDSYFDPCCPAGYYVNISSSAISIGAIVGIVLCVFSFIAIVTFVTCCCFCEACTRKSSAGQILSRTQPSVAHTIRFRLRSHDVPLDQYNNGYLSTQPPPYTEVPTPPLAQLHVPPYSQGVQTPILTQLPPYSQGVQTTPLTQLPPYSQGVQTTPLTQLPPYKQGVQTYLQRQPPPYKKSRRKRP